MSAPSIAQRLDEVRSRIDRARQESARNQDEIRIVAVSKTQNAKALIEAYEHGQRDFAENYVQEAVDKQERLADYPITWHFIGPIQSNKTRLIANRFAWVHSVDRLKIARRLDEQRSGELGPLNICVQINIDSESTKSGIAIEELPEFTAQLLELPRLRFRGLMAIPKEAESIEDARSSFRKMRAAFESLRAQGHAIDTLSMGMSGDFEIAIAEGATLLRIGTSIFGERK